MPLNGNSTLHCMGVYVSTYTGLGVRLTQCHLKTLIYIIVVVFLVFVPNGLCFKIHQEIIPLLNDQLHIMIIYYTLEEVIYTV